MHMKVQVISIILGLMALVQGQEIIPFPAQAEIQGGQFRMQMQTSVVAGPDLKNESDFLRKELSRFTGVMHRAMSVAVARRSNFRGAIVLQVDSRLPALTHRLEIGTQKVMITGSNPEAVFNGAQSFLQLIPGNAPRNLLIMPAMTITDAPSQKVREVKLDLARHLYTTEELKKFINLLAFHKFNRLSLHLSDDQGWRIESKVFPKLHEVGSIRASTPPYGDRYGSDGVEYGGYYPQEKIREMVSYARARHVEIVPVVSLPGRVSPILAAYPGWGNSDLKGDAPKVGADWSSSNYLLAPKEETFAALKEILGELITLFGPKTIGIDDVIPSLEEWKKSSAAQAFLKKKGLKDEAALRGFFLSYLETTAKELGCDVRFESGIEYLRLDRYQRTESLELKEDSEREAVGGLLTTREIYEGEPLPAVLWTQYMLESKKMEYMAFPRLAALAEVLWTSADRRNYDDFLERLDHLGGHYERRKVNVAAPFDEPMRGGLYGTKVTSSLGHYLEHWPEAAFDGNKESFFWSDRGLEKGDHLTLIFPHPIKGDIEVATDGAALDTGAALLDGVLEISPDGETWDAVAEFFDGLATTTAPAGTLGIRVRATEAQAEPLIIHEIVLGERLAPLNFSETREVSHDGLRQLGITLKADFSGHPEFRKKVTALRERYFESWLRIARFLGGSELGGAPRTLEITFGEKTSLKNGVLTLSIEDFKEGSLEEVEGEFVESLVEYLQRYEDGTPLWLASGLQVLIRKQEMPNSAWTKALPKKPRKADAMAGGNGSAAFLSWIAGRFEPFTLTSVSAASRTRYELKRWELTTGLTFENLVSTYQK